VKPAGLLRWYPQAWRERYGGELLALIQDTLADGRPAWRLRLSVAWGGLRERGRQARRDAVAAARRPGWPATWVMFLFGGVFAAYPLAALTGLPPRTRGGQVAMVARDVVLASVALTGALILASVLVALPALVRFLRAGGWRKIRRRVGWAAGASVLAGSALAGLIFLVRSRPFAQLDGSGTYLAVLLAAGVAVVVAIVLWGTAVSAAPWHPRLVPRALDIVARMVVMFMFGSALIWWYKAQSLATSLELLLVFCVLLGVHATVNGRADKRALAAAWRARRDKRPDQN
jgi:hypothetical protein